MHEVPESAAPYAALHIVWPVHLLAGLGVHWGNNHRSHGNRLARGQHPADDGAVGRPIEPWARRLSRPEGQHPPLGTLGENFSISEVEKIDFSSLLRSNMDRIRSVCLLTRDRS
jgi:hypothetical protein